MSQKLLITLLTDFGLQDVYVGVMKGVIATINPQLEVIDLTHQIPPQDIAAGRFALLNAFSYFPSNTVHIAVVDPGVGSNRRGVAIQFSGGFLVGADNGMFSDVLRVAPAIAAVALTNTQYWLRDRASKTFHGRDIFAPVGAHLASGVKLEALGEAIALESLVQMSLPEIVVTNNRIQGCIQYIDGFGNLITNIPATEVNNKRGLIAINQQNIPYFQTYSDVAVGELLALVGSHDWLEIAVNNGSAKDRLQVVVGDEVVFIAQ
jgi:S-adenosylmethionine hydrolase